MIKDEGLDLAAAGPEDDESSSDMNAELHQGAQKYLRVLAFSSFRITLSQTETRSK